METKKCPGPCNSVKPVDDFYIRPNGKPQFQCKVCYNLYMKNHYTDNKLDYIRKARRNGKVSKERIYTWLFEYFQDHPCIDCGNDDPLVLQFDHRNRTEKIDDVSSMIGRGSLRLVKAEVEKCDVRCANCHMRKTAIESNFYWVGFLATRL